MADINSSTVTVPLRADAAGSAGSVEAGPAGSGDEAAPAVGVADRPELVLIELLFFAYRDFVSEPDEALAALGFGRAHHRILHFVSRNPGIPVAELLDILNITKQSLGRVLKQLIDTGHIEQRPGPLDRRQRLLYATAAGRTLALRLIDLQAARIRAALETLPPDERRGAERFLRQMVDPADRAEVARLTGR